MHHLCPLSVSLTVGYMTIFVELSPLLCRAGYIWKVLSCLKIWEWPSPVYTILHLRHPEPERGPEFHTLSAASLQNHFRRRSLSPLKHTAFSYYIHHLAKKDRLTWVIKIWTTFIADISIDGLVKKNSEPCSHLQTDCVISMHIICWSSSQKGSTITYIQCFQYTVIPNMMKIYTDFHLD